MNLKGQNFSRGQQAKQALSEVKFQDAHFSKFHDLAY